MADGTLDPNKLLAPIGPPSLRERYQLATYRSARLAHDRAFCLRLHDGRDRRRPTSRRRTAGLRSALTDPGRRSAAVQPTPVAHRDLAVRPRRGDGGHDRRRPGLRAVPAPHRPLAGRPHGHPGRHPPDRFRPTRLPATRCFIDRLPDGVSGLRGRRQPDRRRRGGSTPGGTEQAMSASDSGTRTPGTSSRPRRARTGATIRRRMTATSVLTPGRTAGTMVPFHPLPPPESMP